MGSLDSSSRAWLIRSSDIANAFPTALSMDPLASPGLLNNFIFLLALDVYASISISVLLLSSIGIGIDFMFPTPHLGYGSALNVRTPSILIIPSVELRYTVIAFVHFSGSADFGTKGCHAEPMNLLSVFIATIRIFSSLTFSVIFSVDPLPHAFSAICSHFSSVRCFVVFLFLTRYESGTACMDVVSDVLCVHFVGQIP